MKIKMKKIMFPALVLVLTLLFTKNVFAEIDLPRVTTACELKNGQLFAINDGFSLRDGCKGESRRVVLIGERGEKGDKGDKGDIGLQGPQGPKGDPAPADTGRHILDLQQVRGANWENTDSVNNVPTPDHVTVNCPKSCSLWVSYDVDTRNTSAPFQHLYMIYVDGVDQAVFNQATMTTPNAAVPLAVNGVFPVSAGQHAVSIYARTYGGTMQQFESHLQVLAVE